MSQQSTTLMEAAAVTSVSPGCDAEDNEPCAVLSVGFAEEQNARFRRTMEDAHTIRVPFAESNTAFFAIYDGHGGDGVAQHASTVLSGKVESHLANNKTPLEALSLAHLDTDKELQQTSHDRFSLTGSTSAVAYVRGRTVYAGNVGDARVVLLPDRRGTAIRMTVDHKGSLESEAVRVRENGGLVLNGRVNAVLLVTRALGDFGLKKWVIADPHVQSARISGKGGCLVVACDGVWDVLEDQAVCDHIVELRDRGLSAEQAAQEIMTEALRLGSTDNISIIVAYLD